MKLPLRYLGHPDLRTKAKKIEEITPEIHKIAADMVETMIAQNGVGIAAPQVGILLRIFVRRDEILHPDGTYTLGEPEVILNPEITKPSQETQTALEGCLSVPGIHVAVTRPLAIHLRYQNLKGEWIEENLKDFIARVTMHENDHLNGVLHIDRTTLAEKKRVEPELQALKRRLR